MAKSNQFLLAKQKVGLLSNKLKAVPKTTNPIPVGALKTGGF